LKKLKTAVIGVGYLGKFHAQKYALSAASELIAVCDNNKEQAQKIANEYQTQAYTDHKDLLDKVDAVSIAVPTPFHFDVAKEFLSAGVHVLIEKPICTTIEDANTLINIAKDNRALLQVGHLERFNNVIRATAPMLDKPRFIESVRLAPFKLRGTDVNVALDLMIHDIDIIHSLVHKNIDHISANGSSVLSEFIDIANARLEFNGGCVANVTASRISLKQERRIRIFQHDAYLSLDLDKKKLYIHKKGKGEMFPGIPKIISEEHSFDAGDALNDEIESFLHCIAKGEKPIVSGEDGRDALAVAIKITKIMRQQNLMHVGDELGRPVSHD
jgi:predicted dehydrogenase